MQEFIFFELDADLYCSVKKKAHRVDIDKLATYARYCCAKMIKDRLYMKMHFESVLTRNALIGKLDEKVNPAFDSESHVYCCLEKIINKLGKRAKSPFMRHILTNIEFHKEEIEELKKYLCRKEYLDYEFIDWLETCLGDNQEKGRGKRRFEHIILTQAEEDIVRERHPTFNGGKKGVYVKNCFYKANSEHMLDKIISRRLTSRDTTRCLKEMVEREEKANQSRVLRISFNDEEYAYVQEVIRHFDSENVQIIRCAEILKWCLMDVNIEENTGIDLYVMDEVIWDKRSALERFNISTYDMLLWLGKKLRENGIHWRRSETEYFLDFVDYYIRNAVKGEFIDGEIRPYVRCTFDFLGSLFGKTDELQYRGLAQKCLNNLRNAGVVSVWEFPGNVANVYHVDCPFLELNINELKFENLNTVLWPSGTSKTEETIRYYVSKVEKTRKQKKPYELDIVFDDVYIRDKRVVMEIDSTSNHDNEPQISRDILKNDKCEEAGEFLVRIIPKRKANHNTLTRMFGENYEKHSLDRGIEAVAREYSVAYLIEPIGIPYSDFLRRVIERVISEILIPATHKRYPKLDINPSRDVEEIMWTSMRRK